MSDIVDVSTQPITVLPPLPPGTRVLKCSSTKLTVLPALPPGLVELECQNTGELTELPALPEGLKILDCSGNRKMTTLPTLPESLEELYISGNPMQVLPRLPDRLRIIDCKYTKLQALPALPQGLKSLNCSATRLQQLPPLPEGLEILFMYDTPIAKPPQLPASLIKLECGGGNGGLVELPPLNEGLQLLICGSSTIPALPPLPTSLIELRCFGLHKLSALPALPKSLKKLICFASPITSLPPLPEGLEHINVSQTKLDALPELPTTLRELECFGTNITALPLLPEGIANVTFAQSINLQDITLPFPKSLHNYDASYIFSGCDRLRLKPRLDEKMASFGERLQAYWYKGYTKEDVELLNELFEHGPHGKGGEGLLKPFAFSICPICLSHSTRQDGCMYMTHTCPKPRHEVLFNRYQVNGKIEWCTLCGRICQGHKHIKENLPTDERFVVLAPGPGANAFKNDCKPYGGGGFEEKFRRIERFIAYACELQGEVGTISDEEARNELVEETWKAGLLRDRAISKKFEKGAFVIPCALPTVAPPLPQVERVYPNIVRPDKDLAPIKYTTSEKQCFVDFVDATEANPVYQFQHRQANGTIWKHVGQYICGEHLEGLLKAEQFTGLCPIDKDNCKARLYPEEIKGIVSDVYYNSYKKLFNEKFAAAVGGRRTRRVSRKQTAGAIVPLMRPVDMDTAECAMPPRSGGTRRGKRSAQRKSRRRA